MTVQQIKEKEIEQLFPYSVTKEEFVSKSKPDVRVVYPPNYKKWYELTDEERFEMAGLSTTWNRIKQKIKEELKKQYDK
jgi:hypothetical protein